MDGFSSECSSGCESGWTMYLDHSSSPNHFEREGDGFIGSGGFRCQGYKGKHVEEEEEEEEEEVEEDLSMVSDASSGPPHLNEYDQDYCDEYGYFSTPSAATALARKSDKRQKMKISTPAQRHQSLLDDTASSTFNFSKARKHLFLRNQNQINQQASREHTLDISQGFSATHYKGRSAFQNHFGYLQTTMPGHPTSVKPVRKKVMAGDGDELS
ncbi:hypothetical protein Scep_000550 [Stephania cephalantha]|uniref:Uncharacterized protein n=1 Tax=Stephania cephalantha TaxID=152367 RepID=A0AAP0LAG4_9MAGN